MTKVGKLLGGGNDTKEQMAKVLELEGKIAKVRKKYCIYCIKYGLTIVYLDSYKTAERRFYKLLKKLGVR